MENINLHTTFLITTRIKAGEVSILWYCWTYGKKQNNNNNKPAEFQLPEREQTA